MRVTWWGHSTVLVEIDGVRVLTDPLLRERVGALRRAAPLPAEALDVGTTVDAVLISHLHHDHCDLPSLRRITAGVVAVPPGRAAGCRSTASEGSTSCALGRCSCSAGA